MPESEPSDLTTVLACAAVEPDLHGLLLFDLAGPLLRPAADAYAQMLAIRYGQPVGRVTLGSYQTEDDLWTSLLQRDADGTSRFAIGPGPLVGGEGQPPLLVVIPDLARASFAVSRAVVELLGAPIATVQRHGVSRTWVPTAHWLASCATADVGQVSPHVLDRFLLRLAVSQPVQPADAVERLLAELAGEGQSASAAEIMSGLPQRWRRALANPPTATFTAAAVRQTGQWSTQQPGMRRQVGLARLARATARLEDDHTVSPEHVDSAAGLVGLWEPAPEPITVEPEPVSPAPQQQAEPAAAPDIGEVAADTVGPEEGTSLEGASPPEVFAASPVPGPDGSPFPEDTASPVREAAPLRPAAQRRRGRPVRSGVVIGTQPSSELADIAWVATAMEAAKHQSWRAQAGGQSGLVVRASDLRSYRRAPASEYLLGLLLDHTCRRERNWDWTLSLAPFLRWAYVHRAGVCVIEVGGAGAPVPLRAERSRVRGMLDPRLAAAMSRQPGTATPLADGLTKLQAEVRHALQHGRGGVTDAIVVVATDGLGNVPLQASVDGYLFGRVRQEGVDDAIAAAAGLAELNRCRCVCVAPPRSAYRHHLERLAQALRAPIAVADEPSQVAHSDAGAAL